MSSSLVDVREVLARDRLSSMKIVAFASPKGGVGKTTICVLTAYAVKLMGLDVAVLDLDITNPCVHVVMGIDLEKDRPLEDRGIVPPTIHGIEVLTPAFFVGNKAVPLRGREIVDAIRELLAITRWRSKLLFVDTPPGLSDELLELYRLSHRLEIVVVTTPNVLALGSAKRLIETLSTWTRAYVVGIVENMYRGTSRALELCSSLGVEYLGYVPYTPELEHSVGGVEVMYRAVKEHIDGIARKIVAKL